MLTSESTVNIAKKTSGLSRGSATQPWLRHGAAVRSEDAYRRARDGPVGAGAGVRDVGMFLDLETRSAPRPSIAELVEARYLEAVSAGRRDQDVGAIVELLGP